MLTSIKVDQMSKKCDMGQDTAQLNQLLIYVSNSMVTRRLSVVTYVTQGDLVSCY